MGNGECRRRRLARRRNVIYVSGANGGGSFGAAVRGRTRTSGPDRHAFHPRKGKVSASWRRKETGLGVTPQSAALPKGWTPWRNPPSIPDLRREDLTPAGRHDPGLIAISVRSRPPCYYPRTREVTRRVPSLMRGFFRARPHILAEARRRSSTFLLDASWIQPTPKSHARRKRLDRHNPPPRCDSHAKEQQRSLYRIPTLVGLPHR